MKNYKGYKTFKQFKKEMLSDPEVKKSYDELRPEFELRCLIMDRRIKEGLTQKELAEKLGTKQSAISRFESGRYNPTIQFLHRLADALGVKIKFSITK